MMYEEKKLYLESYTLQNKRIYRLHMMAETDPAHRKEYEAEIEEALAIKKSIEGKMASIEDGVLKELLYLKYMCDKTLEEIACILNYSTRHTERLHQKALDKFPL